MGQCFWKVMFPRLHKFSHLGKHLEGSVLRKAHIVWIEGENKTHLMWASFQVSKQLSFLTFILYQNREEHIPVVNLQRPQPHVAYMFINTSVALTVVLHILISPFCRDLEWAHRHVRSAWCDAPALWGVSFVASPPPGKLAQRQTGKKDAVFIFVSTGVFADKWIMGINEAEHFLSDMHSIVTVAWVYTISCWDPQLN